MSNRHTLLYIARAYVFVCPFPVKLKAAMHGNRVKLLAFLSDQGKGGDSVTLFASLCSQVKGVNTWLQRENICVHL